MLTRSRGYLAVFMTLAVLAGPAVAQSFHFTVTADNRSSRTNFQHLLTEVTRLVSDEGTFHMSPGDIDAPGDTYADLVGEFGSDVVWYAGVGNHEAETSADMVWIREHYDHAIPHGDPGGYPLPNIVNAGPTGSETTTYSFDYQNAHFVQINEYYNGTSDTGADGDIVPALYDWLAADLAATTQPVIFVFGHEPAFPFNRHVGDSLDAHPTNRDSFWDLLESYHVAAYFCGHTHYYSTYQKSGGTVWQIDVGNAGNEPDATEGGTFVDVVVNGGTVQFNVYRGLFTEPFSLADSWSVSSTDPAAADDAYSTAVDALLTVAAPGVLENDSDPNGDPITAVLETAPSNGALQSFSSDGSFEYQPNFGYTGTDTFTYHATDGVNDSAPAAVTITVANEATETFQQGAGGYAGTVDTYLSENSSTTSNASAASLTIDADEPPGLGTATQGLLRFDNIIGSGQGQIPPSSTILSATLTLNTTNPGNGATLHRMLGPWADTDTWDSLLGGIQTDDVEAMATADVNTGSVATGSTVLDVTASVQAWVDGQDNEGWAFLPLGTDGWDFNASEGTTPPLLTVTRSTAAPPAAPANLSATAGAGSVTLDWDDNTEPSLAGYRVYRSEVTQGPYTLISGEGEDVLQPADVTASTGEKPQSKLWRYAGAWWCVLADASGTWVRRLDGDTWTSVLQVSTKTTIQADCEPDGAVTRVLLYDGVSTQLASVEYVPGQPGGYQSWPAQPNLVNIPLSTGVETATIDIDSRGRMWLASDGETTIEVRYSDSPYTSWSAPITLASGTLSDDICLVTTLSNGTIGVLWSNQVTKRFGFRVHGDGGDPETWSADEVPAGDSALDVGAGMADDHLNVAVGSDGTLYAAVKTSYDTAGYAKIAFLVRHPGGAWDPLYEVDSSGTRPIVLLDEARCRVLVIYTRSEGYNDIVYRESDTNSIAFGNRQTFLAGSYNDVSGMKQNIDNDAVVLASSSTSAVGKRLTFAALDPLASTYTDRDVTAGTAYYYTVTAVDSLGQESGLSNEAGALPGAAQEPAAPSNLAATAVSSSRIDLTWTDNAVTEDGFEIERSPDGTAWALIATVGAGVTAFSDTGLSPLTTYHYQVLAYNGGGSSAYSNSASATTLDVNHPPVAEDQSVATNEDTDVTITLVATDDDGPLPLTYFIDTPPARGTLGPLSGNQVTYTPDADYAGGDSFTFHANDGEDDSNSATVTLTVNAVNDPPSAPQNLSATANAGSVTLNWADNTEPEGDLAGYNVYRSTAQGGPYGAPINDAGLVAESQYTDSTVTNGTTYYYVVTAVDAGSPALESPPSQEVSATPSDTAHDAYASQDPTVTSGTLGGNGFAGTTTEGDGLVQTILEAPSGPKGRASLDAEYVLTTPADPAAVTVLVLHLTATWTDLDAADPLKVSVWNKNSQAWDDVSTVLQTGTFQLTGAASHVEAGGSIRVRFTDTGPIDKESKDTVTIDLLYAHVEAGPPDTDPPAPPAGLVGTPVDLDAQLSWTANTEPDLAGYRVYRSATQGGPYTLVTTALVPDAQYTDAVGLAGTYYYVVTAEDQAGNESGDSNEASVTLVDAPPAPPAGLAAAPGDGQVSLDWNDNTESDLAGYNVYRSTAQGGPYGAPIGTPINGTTLVAESQYTDSTVTNGTKYYYVVTAVDTGGNESGNSNEASATPQAGTGPTLHVAAIDMTSKKAGPNYSATATVTIQDAGGAPVEGATVSGTWSGDVSGSATGVTGPDGTVAFNSSKAKNGGTFTFTVDDVVLAGGTYDPASNAETSDSITVP